MLSEETRHAYAVKIAEFATLRFPVPRQLLLHTLLPMKERQFRSNFTHNHTLSAGLRASPAITGRARNYLAVFETEQDVRKLQPDMATLLRLDCLGIIATAPGENCDFVSRFFAPRAGVPEDPVTGSAHCTLIPYWAQRLGRTVLHARQLSP